MKLYISTVLWVHKKLPQSTVKLVLPSNKSYESKTGCNRTLATVLWVPLTLSSWGKSTPCLPDCHQRCITVSLSRTRNFITKNLWDRFRARFDKKGRQKHGRAKRIRRRTERGATKSVPREGPFLAQIFGLGNPPFSSKFKAIFSRK